MWLALIRGRSIWSDWATGFNCQGNRRIGLTWRGLVWPCMRSLPGTISLLLTGVRRIGRLAAPSCGMKGCRLNEDRLRDRPLAIWLWRNFCPNLNELVPVAMQWQGRLRSDAAHGGQWSRGNKRHYVCMGSGCCAICCDEDLAFPLLRNDHCNSAIGERG